MSWESNCHGRSTFQVGRVAAHLQRSWYSGRVAPPVMARISDSAARTSGRGKAPVNSLGADSSVAKASSAFV